MKGRQCSHRWHYHIQQGGENAMWNIKATWESVVVIYGSILLLTLAALLLVIPNRGSLAWSLTHTLLSIFDHMLA